MRPSAPKERLRDLFSSKVVSFWDNFSDHSDRILSRQPKRVIGANIVGRTGNRKLTTSDCSYTGTATFSMMSFSTWSDCSDFFNVEA